jgi:hypothetical protein
MTELKTYYGILDNGQLRNGFAYTSLKELLESVSESIMDVTDDPEIIEISTTADTLDKHLTILYLHGFEPCKIPMYVAKEIKQHPSAVVNMDPQYFYDGSLYGVKELSTEEIVDIL